MNAIKYPRTPHLPSSPGATNDDRILPGVEHFVGREVVATEKLDGECSTLYGVAAGEQGYMHARSLDGHHHASQAWLKGLYAQIKHDIPTGWRVCGENCYAMHHIGYASLPSYFFVYSIWDETNTALSWSGTETWAELLGLRTVPVLYRGIWDEQAIQRCYTGTSRFSGSQEGYVVRLASHFLYRDFGTSVAKWVSARFREELGDGTEHWAHKAVMANGLAR